MSDRARTEELAALVAAGGASDAERSELESIIAADPAAAAELAAYQECAAALALVLEPVAPPAAALAGIKKKLAGRSGTIAGPAPAPAASTAPEYAGRRDQSARGGEVIDLASRRKPRIWAAVTALSLAAAAALLVLWLRDRAALKEDLAAKDAEIDRVLEDAQREIDELGRRLEAAGREAQTLRARFEPLAGSTQLSLTRLSSDDGGVAHVLADKSGKTWLVIAVELPEIEADQDYQLWFVPESGKPISAGLLRPGPDGVLAATPELPPELAGSDAPIRPAISLEPRGGSPQPTAVKMIGNPI